MCDAIRETGRTFATVVKKVFVGECINRSGDAIGPLRSPRGVMFGTFGGGSGLMFLFCLLCCIVFLICLVLLGGGVGLDFPVF